MKNGDNSTDTNSNPKATGSKHPRAEGPFKVLESKMFWLAVVLILFSTPLIFSFKRPPLPELPVLYQLEDFKLTNQDGRSIDSKEFGGSVLLVNFIFTRCPDTCPLLTQRMAQVQNRLKGTAKSIQLLSITVDPEYDTPEVLKKYAARFGAQRALWTFATGSLEAIESLVVGGFKQALERQGTELDGTDNSEVMMEITHGEHFVLVDHMGRIRGFRRLQSDQDINKIIRELAILVNSPPKNATSKQSKL